jgi:TnpA family transposase
VDVSDRNKYYRKNQLYLAFRDLWRAVRTVFLFRYVCEIDLRRKIQGAINKSQGFNKFAQWVAICGYGVIAETFRGEQRKLINFNNLVYALYDDQNTSNSVRRADGKSEALEELL